MKYRISEVSKIVDIPIDTIRYYVKLGIISPKTEGKFRYYDAWDINYLLEYKKYRSLELSMKEIKNIFKDDCLESYTRRFEDLKSYYEYKEKYYKLLSMKVKNDIDTLNKIPESIQKFQIMDMPEMFYFYHRHNYEYGKMDKLSDISLKWINDYFSFVDGIVVFDKDNLFSQNPKDEYDWGFAMRSHYKNELNVQLNDDIKCFNNSKALYTILYAGGKGTFNIHLLTPIKEYISKNNYHVAGNIIGNLLARVHDNGEFRRYVEFWIPIE